MGIGDHQRHIAQDAQDAQDAPRQRAKEVKPEGLGLGRADAVERLDSAQGSPRWPPGRFARCFAARPVLRPSHPSTWGMTQTSSKTDFVAIFPIAHCSLHIAHCSLMTGVIPNQRPRRMSACPSPADTLEL